jgi:hypothetical protein
MNERAQRQKVQRARGFDVQASAHDVDGLYLGWPSGGCGSNGVRIMDSATAGGNHEF